MGDLTRPRFESYPCDLCGSSDGVPVIKKTGDLIRTPFTVLRCKNCSHIRVSPRICDDQIPDLYGKDYYEGRGFDRTVDYTAASESNYRGSRIVQDIVRTVSQLFPDLTGAIKALDFGCGLGDLVLGMRDAGFESYGFDSSQYAAAVHRQRAVPTLDDFETSPERYVAAFDLVTCVEVIEHTTSPTEFLLFLRRFIKPGGFLFILTGNWHVQRRVPGTPYVMPEGHIQYFTPRTLGAFLRKAGFGTAQVSINYAWFGNRMLPFDAPPAVRRLAQNAVMRLLPEYGPMPIGQRQ